MWKIMFSCGRWIKRLSGMTAAQCETHGCKRKPGGEILPAGGAPWAGHVASSFVLWVWGTTWAPGLRVLWGCPSRCHGYGLWERFPLRGRGCHRRSSKKMATTQSVAVPPSRWSSGDQARRRKALSRGFGEEEEEDWHCQTRQGRRRGRERHWGALISPRRRCQVVGEIHT